MARRKLVYEGKAKILYEGPDQDTLIQYFKDDATAFNAEKKDTIAGKGVLNNRISAHLMTKLEGIGIPTHFIRSVNMREQLIRKVEIIPIELVVRNIAAGSLCKRLGIKEGTVLGRPLIATSPRPDEQRRLVGTGQFGPRAQPCPDRVARLAPDRDDPILAPLAGDAHEPVVEVDVARIEIDEFGEAQPR